MFRMRGAEGWDSEMWGSGFGEMLINGYTDFTVGLHGADGWWDKSPVGALLSQA